jgi:hypothetical protein
MSEKISSELDFSNVVNNHSTVLYRKISPQGAATNIDLSLTSSIGPVEIVVPPSVWNPSKSKLNFQIQLPTTGGAAVANFVNGNGLSCISRLVVYDAASGSVWCDVSNFEKYATIVPVSTHINEFLTKGGQGVAVGATSKQMALTAANSAKQPYEDIVKCASTSNLSFAAANLADATEGVNPILGRRQLVQGVVNEVSFIDFCIPFSAFKFTALSLNKNIYSPSQIVIQLYFNALDNFAFKSAVNLVDNLASVASGKLNNVSMTIANEGNLAVVSQIINKVMTTGLSLPIAYPTVSRQQLSGSAAHSYNLQLTAAYGSRILGIITVPFQGATLPLKNSHARPTNLTTINTFMNGVALKYPNGFDTTLAEDWKFNAEPYYKDSAVQNVGEFVLAEYALIDSFFGDKSLCTVEQSEIDGLAVTSAASTWQIQANYSDAQTVTYVSVIIGQKQLTLSNSGSLVQ